jgi:hypothetical protein
MVKETKFFRKQAQKADNAAARVADPELEAEFRALARAYRSQAATLKRNKAKQKPKNARPKKRSTQKRVKPGK